MVLLIGSLRLEVLLGFVSYFVVLIWVFFPQVRCQGWSKTANG